MSVSVAEYLGQRTDIVSPVITPTTSGNCPFMNAPCSKIAGRHKPVCIVRLTNGQIWIVCKNRLSATNKNISLLPHQTDVLLNIARSIVSPNIQPSDVLVKREVPVPVVGRSTYKADYVMLIQNQVTQFTSHTMALIEMQGGGETSNTGDLTEHIKKWETTQPYSNQLLAKIVDGVNPIETNAWRRQQEQFIVKGNIVQQTGGVMVLCLGAPLYDYLFKKVQSNNLPSLRQANWTLALIGFSEVKQNNPGPIQIEIDKNRMIFTNYMTFVQALINQGGPVPKMFKREFTSLTGNRIIIP